MGNKKYFAFVSYSHKDSELAKWLQHEFEYYELPAKLFEERKDLRKEDLPESFRPVFRDEDELSGGELKPQISEALADSEYLIVVCSPHSAQSVYVDSEIKEFISLSQENKRRIFPFIVDGKPHQDDDNKEKECFPKTLLELSEDKSDPIELIAGDIHATGRDHAFVKILAGTLVEKDIRFADLWNRYAEEKAKKERKEREDKEKLQIAQSRFVAEKALQLINDYDVILAKKILIKVLPKDLSSPTRPYTEEAEFSLRKAISLKAGHHILQNHKGTVKCVAYSPLGDMMVSSSADKTIMIWNVRDWSCKRVLYGHLGAVNSVSFSPNGDRIVSTSVDKSVRVWDVQKGLCQLVCQGHSKGVSSACFSLDGERIFSASQDGAIFVWDAKSGQCIKELHGHSSFVNSVALSPNGLLIISGSSDRTARLWDSNTGDCLNVFKGHQGSVYSTIFDKEGKMIATTSDDNSIILWDINGNVIKKYEGHEKAVLSVGFSNDNRKIISSSLDKTIRIWDISTGFCLKTLHNHRESVNCIANSPITSTFVSASSDESIQAWEYDNKEYSHSFSGYGKCFLENDIVFYEDLKCDYLKLGAIDVSTGASVFNMDVETVNVLYKPNVYFTPQRKIHVDVRSVYCSPDGSWRNNPYILLSPNAKYLGVDLFDSIRFIESLSGNVIEINVSEVMDDNLFHRKNLNTFCFLNDELVIVKTKYTNKKTIEEPNSIRIDSSLASIWKIEPGEKVFSYEGDAFDNDIITISPDGDQIIVSSFANISLWDLHSGICIKEVVITPLLKGKVEKIFPLNVLYSPDGSYVALGYSVDIDNYDDWQEYHRYQVCLLDRDLNPIHVFTSASLACFSPVSKQILIRNISNQSYEVWDIVNADIISATPNFFFNEIEGNMAVLSSSGNILVTATNDFTLMICILSSFSMFRTMDGHTDTILSIDISPNEEYIATSSSDKTIKIWTVKTGRCVQQFTGHTGRVMKVSFSADGRRIVSTSDDNTIKIWDFPPLQELINQTIGQFQDNPLTYEEKIKYYLE